MRLLLLTGALLLSPLPAAAFDDYWTCEPADHLVCRAGESCQSVEPSFSQVEIMPITGRLSFCIAAQCYEGVMELEREGWPGYRSLGFATVEALPLPAYYTGGEPYFVGFDAETGRFTLSRLGIGGQQIAWFDCKQWTAQ